MKTRIVLLSGSALFIAAILLKLVIVNDFLYKFSPQAIVNLDQTTGEYDPSIKTAVFDNKDVEIPETLAQDIETNSAVLGETTDAKRIEVDLTNQRLYAYEGDKQIYNFSVSTGKWGKTPTGKFKIWVKLRHTKMEGGSKALNTYYYLANVPYVMFFANEDIPKWRGFGLHGTYWHDNFGHPMSHGCVNMKTEEAGLIYAWAAPELENNKKSVWASNENSGTEILIYGKAPAT